VATTEPGGTASDRPRRRRLVKILALITALVVGALGAILVFGVGLGGLLGEPAFPRTGVTLDQGIPTVYIKLCASHVIGRLVVGRVDKGQHTYDATPVWTANLDDRAMGRTALTLADAIPGYRVATTLDGSQLDPSAHYSLLAASDDRGSNILATVNDFHLRDLQEGMVLDDGTRHPLAKWLSPSGPACH
jgi:hypothetical protein